MSKAGWEEHLRTFISAASAGESEPLTKEVLWIYAPDFNRQGVIGDIKNVTNRETEYEQLWNGLDYMETRYSSLALTPINERLDEYRTEFMDAYQSLDTVQKRKFENLSAGAYRLNPFDKQSIQNLYGAGLDEDTYKELVKSRIEVNMTLGQPFAQVTGSRVMNAKDEENFKFLYRHRDYFQTLEFHYDEVREWLVSSVQTTLVDMGVSEEMIKSQT